MKILLKFIFIFFIFINFSKADLIKPNITLKPFDILMIQLNSLKNNNVPFKDSGIEQTWVFAHPNYNRMTGPLEKFKKMIYGKSYEMLIGHENNEIVVLNETNNRSVYKVYILSKEKKILLYMAN